MSLFKKKVATNHEANNKIRLFYISLERFSRYNGLKLFLGTTVDASTVYKLPEGMTKEDAYKVISYLSETIEKENNIEPASRESMQEVAKILPKFGFKELSGSSKTKANHYHSVSSGNPYYNKIADGIEEVFGSFATPLYTIGGDVKEFEKSDLYKDYFDWFTPNVSYEEVKQIYNNLKAEKETTFEE